jgi:dipeptidyl-peptidase-4
MTLNTSLGSIFKFVKNETAIRFRVTSTEKVKAEEKKESETDSTASKKKSKPKMENKVYHLEYVLGGNGLTVIDNEKEEKRRMEALGKYCT